MGTDIRPQLSGKNPYWISKHRYYELKHFCLQYPVWKKACASLRGSFGRHEELNTFFQRNKLGDPTQRYGIAMAYFSHLSDMVEQSAREADPVLGDYILKGVTEGISYDLLRAKTDIPCSKDTYYDRYRKFFWILSKKRE